LARVVEDALLAAITSLVTLIIAAIMPLRQRFAIYTLLRDYRRRQRLLPDIVCIR